MKKLLTTIGGMLFACYTYAAPVTIDVMVVYDNSAQAYLTNNNLNQDQFAANVMNQLQVPYINSGLDVEFNLVHTMSINYDSVAGTNGSGIGNDLDNISDNTVVQNARANHNADLVQLFVNLNRPATGSWASGIANLYIPNNPAWYSKAKAYSVVSIQDVGTGISGTAAHEIGHNLGALHDAANMGNVPSTWGTPDYARGYVYSATGATYHTVMAYNLSGYNESPYFSTPCKEYPVGAPVGTTDSANNTRFISKNMGTVASYYGAPQTSTEIVSCSTGSETGRIFIDSFES